MKRFFLHIVSIVGCVLILTFSLGYIVNQGLIHIQDSRFQEWNAILDGDINAEVVVLGSSRGVVSYDPTIISNSLGLTTHNLSYNAGSYNLQIDKYNIYRNKNRSPKIIIQNIDLSHFSPSTHIPNTIDLLPHTNMASVEDLFNKYKSDSKVARNFGVVKYSNYSRYLLKGIYQFFGISQKVGFHDKGHASVDKKYKEDTSNLYKLKELASTNTYENIEKGFVETLQFTKEQSKNCDFVFVSWLPEYKDRFEINSAYTKKLKERIKAWSDTNERIYFIDLTHYDSIMYHKKYFYDSFHLNKRGAEVISKGLSGEINKIIKDVF
ncbi:hypothetical protein [Dokdonia sp.]|uniref:hypothetical protein n=1 Tax=Dokdonia sp. TaxID=2024995 RepID=UPI00326503DA